MITRRNLGSAFAAVAMASGLGAAALGAVAPQAARAQDDSDQSYPNVFISPFGQPFRAKLGAPYPVVDWFKQVDKDADGKIDHAEFMADAAAFFKILDINGDDVLSSREVLYYEYRVAPEIIGIRAPSAALDYRSGGARLWLTQGAGGVMGAGQMGGGPEGGSSSDRKLPQFLDESKTGASPFSFFDQPEPVTAADLNFNGRITKANFLRLAGVHFDTLDRKGVGYLTLADLPKTPVQKVLEKARRRR
jgi:hypothetical protein